MNIPKTISSHKIPIRFFLDEIEDNALNQAINLANHPNAFHHIAIMPDAHSGFGMPIGGVMAAIDAVIPNAVGVDIGCGVAAVETKVKASELTPDLIRKIMSDIRAAIPVGFNHHEKDQSREAMPKLENGLPIVAREYSSALRQIGTLGGGNHFLELQRDSKGMLWLMVHSGSRNVGKQVADHYGKLATQLNWGKVPISHELDSLDISSPEGKAYMAEMEWCVKFARLSRKLMICRMMNVVQENVGKEIISRFQYNLDVAHNYARMEKHFDKDVIVHRKGATCAEDSLIGIVPGSQGSRSFIVKGKGNPDSFNSCSHGAGRVMSRAQAKKTLNLAEEQKKLDDKGIIHSIRSESDLDEATSVYKDIDQVMRNQAELVDIVEVLEPLAVIKG